MLTSPTTQPETAERGWLATCVLRLSLAVTFLTRLPLPITAEVTPVDLQASMGWYPLVGLVLGAVGAGLFAVGRLLFPAPVVAALVIILLEAFTGALHLDGFMDTCDGLGSGKPRERALEIMKDSRVGAMGVFGAVAVIVLKVAALATFATPQAALVLCIGWPAARALPIWNVSLFPYARAAGTGGAFTEGKSQWALIFATLSAVIIAVFFGGVHGLLLLLLAILLTLLIQANIALKLHGLTGDVYGMGIEMVETLVLLLGTALIR